ncbi:hypothetical protein [Pandoravirus japonicus]|uniref:Uncharacterized protein n=1 Tax=Pandoravirus japonicus TaxID=2823154 RepID=A0A811BLR8_9VIRU|nr:hypothetical protein [Pandoravirus japonicus]
MIPLWADLVRAANTCADVPLSGFLWPFGCMPPSTGGGKTFSGSLQKKRTGQIAQAKGNRNSGKGGSLLCVACFYASPMRRSFCL